MRGHSAIAWIQDNSIAYAIFPNCTIRIGRSRDSHLRLCSDDKVSRDHCIITSHYDWLEIADVGSRNGTRINRRPVLAQTQLFQREIISVGETELTVLFELGQDDENAADFRIHAEVGGYAVRDLDQHGVSVTLLHEH